MAAMKLSVIIPAYNEEVELPECLTSVVSAFDAIVSERKQFAWELIVTDNNSTDSTAEVARQYGANVIFEPVNQIARARNAGAAAATGQWLLFIDADSRLHADSIREMLALIDTGTCGAGGCLVHMDNAPFLGRCLVRTWNGISRLMNWAAGSFVFCRRDAFRDIGGFDEQFFAAEELYFSSAIKKWCLQHGLNFHVMRKQPHTSSARKFHSYSTLQVLRMAAVILLSFPRAVRNRSALQFFYDRRS